VSTLLAIIPHPDDESYAFAGTIALAARAGWRCLVECVTFGEGGQRHDGGDPDRGVLALTRARELDASCRLLGAGPPDYWGWPDGGLAERKDGVRRARAAMRRAGADVVLGPGLDGAYGHPDHLAVHRWIAEGVEALEEQPLVLFAAFPEGLFVPQYEKCVASGIMGDPPQLGHGEVGLGEPDLRIDVESARDLKLAAIGAHRSQLPAGEPRALFPPGIVDRLQAEEWFTVGGQAIERAQKFGRALALAR
jgi:LmbE family N-acetylglucosaminyl deacetylase